MRDNAMDHVIELLDNHIQQKRMTFNGGNQLAFELGPDHKYITPDDFAYFADVLDQLKLRYRGDENPSELP